MTKKEYNTGKILKQQALLIYRGGTDLQFNPGSLLSQSHSNVKTRTLGPIKEIRLIIHIQFKSF